jgi:AraC-like DNA-binding protein
MTFSRFVNRLRIYTACQLLMGEQKSVMEICYQVGFNNVSNFNRQFFVQKGMSPSKFRTLSENKATTFAA